MLTLRTSGNFTVVRQIANHLDSDTNYVRAVIRNAYTDAILDTLDLTDKGSQRFSKNWRVPGDPSGEGFYISIVTSVYSDSGYTTKNANYGDEENTYLVADREGALRGGGSGVDARTVRRIISEELDKLPKPEKVEMPEMEKMPEMKWDTVLSAINELKVALKPIKPEKVDFKPVYDSLQTILNAVEEKEVTPVTNLEPILQAIDEQDTNLARLRGEVLGTLDTLDTTILKTVPKEIASLIRGTTFGISLTPTTIQGKEKEEEEEPKEKDKPFDVSKLST